MSMSVLTMLTPPNMFSSASSELAGIRTSLIAVVRAVAGAPGHHKSPLNVATKTERVIRSL
jgi:hypothetical protein